jgi:hypothetical protein
MDTLNVELSENQTKFLLMQSEFGAGNGLRDKSQDVSYLSNSALNKSNLKVKPVSVSPQDL